MAEKKYGWQWQTENGGLDYTPLSRGMSNPSFASLNNYSQYAPKPKLDMSSVAPQGGGGDFMSKLNPIANAATTGFELIGSAIEEGKGQKYKDYASNFVNTATQAGIDNTNTIRGLNTNKSLMDYNNNFVGLDPIKIKGKSFGQGYLEQNLAALKGATSGAFFGPIGAIAGGVIGGVSSIIGQLSGNEKRKQAEGRIASAASAYNSLAKSNLNNRISNVDSQNDMRAMSNYAEYGGYIPTMSGAIGYELANKQLGIDNLFAINSAKNVSKLETGGNLNSAIPNIGQHGGMFSNGVNVILNGGLHSTNPLGGVPMGVDQNGVPNLVEEGEVKWNDYIFSQKLNLDEISAKNNVISDKYVGKTYADIAKAMNDESSERPNDPVSIATLKDNLTRLMTAQEEERAVKDIEETNKFASGGNLNTWLQAAPIIGSGFATAADAIGLTNNNNYQHVDAINMPAATPLISPERIGNYMSYVPLDKDYYLNRQAAQTAATRSAISNASNGNRGSLMNALAAVDIGSNMAEGNLARQATEMDIAQQAQVANFNRGTNMFNSQQEMQAAAQNSDAYRWDARVKAEMEMNKAQMKQAIDVRDQAQRDANLSNFYNNLGMLGKERIAMNAIMSNPGLYYYWDKDGTIQYKGGYENLTPEQKAIVDADIAKTKPANIKKCGGKLNIKTM